MVGCFICSKRDEDELRGRSASALQSSVCGLLRSGGGITGQGGPVSSELPTKRSTDILGVYQAH